MGAAAFVRYTVKGGFRPAAVAVAVFGADFLAAVGFAAAGFDVDGALAMYFPDPSV
jgi:hypothetical protein